MQGKKWTITKEFVSDPEENIKFQEPRGNETLKFRLLDDDGEVYFIGVMVPTNDEDMFEPLDEFGEGYGCVQMQVFSSRYLP